MKDTITESELAAAYTYVVKSTTHPISSRGIRAFLSEVGITVVPDPIPEPEGDVIVADARGGLWQRKDGYWDGNLWETVLKHGPVKIYRLEES